MMKKDKEAPGTTVRPDSKGRITLGKLAEGVSSYRVEKQPDQSLVLTPMAEVPAYEKWLWENPKALESVKEGLKESAEGQAKPAGDFSQYADDEIEDSKIYADRGPAA